MNTAIRRNLALGGAVAAIAWAAPAVAQTADQATGNDIIVTAQRVEERLQDVPVSITVYNQEQLANRNIAVAADLATYTPSLSVNQRYGPEKSSFAIRGFNQDVNTAPTVGVYFADVVGVRAQGGVTSGNNVGAGAFTDLQNVQVLKGPQGTLFGRNTTGGAVLLVPQKPTDRLEGYVEGSIGNYGMKRIQGALNVPLSGTFRIRAAIDAMNRDGYMRNMVGTGVKDFNDVNYFYGRLGIVADLASNLENYTLFHYSRSRTHGYAYRMSVCDTNYAATAPTFFPLPTGPFPNHKLVGVVAACEQIARQATRGDGPLDVEVGAPENFLRLQQWQVINTTTWKASDNLTIKNIASYGQYREHLAGALSTENFTIPARFTGVFAVGSPYQNVYFDTMPGQPYASESTLTEELQLQGHSADGKFNYVVGGYLEFSRPIGWNSARAGIFANCTDPSVLACTAPVIYGFIQQTRNRMSFDNHGIFAQGTYNFTEKLALTAGVRYTFDKITGDNEGTRYTLVAIPGVGTIPVAQSCNDSLRRAGIDVLATGDTSKCRTSLNNTSNKPTWLIGLDYKPTPDTLLYAKYSRGYRQGGLNFVNIGLETWKPEKVDAYELGAKLSFRGAVSGYFNAAAFYNNFTNQQIFGGLVAAPGSGISGGSGILNAGKSELYGLEVDASATFNALRIDLGYTFLKTRVKDVLVPNLAGTPYVSFFPNSQPGGELTLSPRHRLTITGTIKLPVNESIGNVSFGATFTYTDKQLADSTSPIGVLPSSSLLNLNLNWDKAFGSPIDLAVFATNVTNRIYPVNIGGTYGGFGFDGYLYGQPRMYGARVRVRFGD